MRTFLSGAWKVMIILPVISLIVLSLGIWVLFPEFADFEGWVWEGFGSIPFIAWALIGAVMGAVVYFVHEKWPDKFRVYLRNIIMGYMGWLGIAVAAAMVMGEGDITERIGSSSLLKGWAVLFFSFAASMPTLLGVHALLSGSRITTGGSVMSVVMIATSVMIFSQAESNTILVQDPLISMVTIWALIGFIEGISWIRRYGRVSPGEEGDVLRDLFRRQVASTLLIMGVASAAAYGPFVMDIVDPGLGGFLLDSYEIGTVHGKAILSILTIAPIAVFSLIRRLLDRKDRNGK